MNRATNFPLVPQSFVGTQHSADIEWKLDQLRSLYESLGPALDLFTTRDFDSPFHFEFADEIEIGLILLFSALDADLPAEGGPVSGNRHEGAERLKEAAQWLCEVVTRLESEFDAMPLASRLETMAELCQALSSAIWWQWLAEIELRIDDLPIRAVSRSSTEPTATLSPSAESATFSLN
ncbi:MAG: hypothetical protein KDN20_07905 [Verrucomicrobiae bacterium]|nr:hypothetical protein [Verrucomicrobiae bacterium]